jgi:cytoskeletal protein CcmA (bactofilin family)
MANRPVGDGTMNTLVGSGTAIEGTLKVSSSMRVDGSIKGKINCSDTLLVGKTGVIEAKVRVKSATIGGKVSGDITAEDVVVLEGNSTLIGDVTTKKLIIEEGAVFNGTCRMGELVKKAELKKEESPKSTPPAGAPDPGAAPRTESSSA